MKTTIYCTVISMLFGLQSIALAETKPKGPSDEKQKVPVEDQQKEDPNLIKLTWDDNEKPLKLPMDKTIEIRLVGNPTSGFQWQTVEVKGKAVKEKQEVEYVPDKYTPPRVGSGGVFVFRFMPVEVGKASVKLHYFRPWEIGTPPEKVFKIDVEVVEK